MLKAQRVHSGKEAFEVLLFKSVRTRYDVENSLNYRDIWRNSIIVRKWIDIEIDMEFRGFVHNKELTALCQYSHDLYFPDLEEKMPDIVDRIEKFFDQVKDIIPYNDFVIDFLFLDKIYIIELNPLDAYSGPALFNYKVDLDLLLHPPLTVRIQTLENYKQEITNSWNDVITLIKEEIIEERLVEEEEKKEKDSRCIIS